MLKYEVIVMLKGWQLIEIIAGMVRKMHCQPPSNHPSMPIEVNLENKAPLRIPTYSALLRTLIFFLLGR